MSGSDTMDMFTARRERFMSCMGSAIAVFPSAPVSVKSNDVEFDYRQDSDLYYLTGFEEPQSVAVLTPNSPEHHFVLFVRPHERDKEIWTGRRAGSEGAVKDYGADAAFPIEELAGRLPGLMENVPRLYYRLGHNRAFDADILAALDQVRSKIRTGVRPPSEIVDPTVILHEQRLLKTGEELRLLRRACDITCEAHRAAMDACRCGMTEYELEAMIEYVFRKQGSSGPGYPSIVGAGANATVLHYCSNRGLIRDGDLVLIDAGCEWNYYNADVTRTFPASGTFTKPQRTLYEIVLAAQLAAIEQVRPGCPFDAFHDTAVRVVTEEMVRIGLLDGVVSDLIETSAYRRFYPHRTGHWLGLDVHDVGLYKLDGGARALEAGMVLTVEPGLYVQPDDAAAPEEFRGIGVRIEDDVLVTPTGCEVLTSGAPKVAKDVEQAVGRRSAFAS